MLGKVIIQRPRVSRDCGTEVQIVFNVILVSFACDVEAAGVATQPWGPPGPRHQNNRVYLDAA